MSSKKQSPQPSARGPRGSGARRGRGSEREVSAGGVVVREDRDVVVIVPTRRAPNGSRVLGLPKGHVDPGETALQAAAREVREETGITAELLRDLGEVRYWYRREGRTISKAVSFYLFRYLHGDTEDHDDEVEEARWMPLTEAQTALSHSGEREMVTRALVALEEARSKDR